MALAGIPISENECIGDSLATINSALQTLDGKSGVSKIIAGTNITISPTGGTGDVTINGLESGAKVTIQSTPPSSPEAGDLWFDNDSGILSMYYNDGNSSQWVDVGGGDSGTGAGSVDGIVQCDGNGNFSAAVAGTDYAIGVQGAKAWVNFNGVGTATIRDDFNVSSITDNNEGDYTINFVNSMSSSQNYAVLITASFNGTGIGACLVGFEAMPDVYPSTNFLDKTANRVRIYVSNNDSASFEDAFSCNVAVFSN